MSAPGAPRPVPAREEAGDRPERGAPPAARAEALAVEPSPSAPPEARPSEDQETPLRAEAAAAKDASAARAPFDRMLAAVRALVSAHAAETRAFADALFQSAPAFAPPTPRALPHLAEIEACRALSAPLTAPLTDAVLDAADRIDWRQSYREEDGFTRAYLDHYGWFNLVSPDGPFRSDAIRVAFGYWGEGLVYPAHSHAPEEIYLVLSGRCRFFAEGRPPRDCGPGDAVRHASRQIHGIAMTPGPMLVLGLWRGEELLGKSRLFPGEDPIGMDGAP